MYSTIMQPTTESVGCVRAATEILGDKWTPLLLRCFLNEETVRFCHLQDSVGGINPRTLSARLVSLEETGIIQKLTSGDSSHCTYRLTQKGVDLLPILQDMHAWGTKYAKV
jgi:DNA-binding HxlR family transcriptional regulator